MHSAHGNSCDTLPLPKSATRVLLTQCRRNSFLEGGARRPALIAVTELSDGTGPIKERPLETRAWQRKGPARKLSGPSNSHNVTRGAVIPRLRDPEESSRCRYPVSSSRNTSSRP